MAAPVPPVILIVVTPAPAPLMATLLPLLSVIEPVVRNVPAGRRTVVPAGAALTAAWMAAVQSAEPEGSR